MVAHAAKTFRAELSGELLVAIDLPNSIGEALRIVGPDEQATAGLFDNLRKATATWLHQRHAASHRFEQRNAFWFVVRSGNRHHIEATQKRDLLRAIEYAAIVKLVAQTSLFEFLL